MKTKNTKPLYSKKEIITKEVIRGHLRNWLCEKIIKKNQSYNFIFEMENMMIRNKFLVIAYSYKPKTATEVVLFGEYKSSPKTITFYIDNIMRHFLFYNGNNGSYLEATKKNLMLLKKMLKPIFKEQL